MANKTKPPERKLDATLHVKLTRSELDQISKEADIAGESMSAFVRRRIFEAIREMKSRRLENV